MTAPPESPPDAPAKAPGLAAYATVTAAYWGFMLTDGALRMLVLLQFNALGFSPVSLAFLFVLYEVAGIVTNLYAGWLAARFGLAATLHTGLALQIMALLALTALDPAWSVPLTVAFVMLVQGASGVAKDLAKMSAKSAVKLLAPEGGGTLFRWVALLTGSKNAVKGAGFFAGAVLLGVTDFTTALLAMAGVLALVLLLVLLLMPAGLPAGKKAAKVAEVFSKDRNVNRLSAARVFLFGARDVWFVVGIPVFFYGVLLSEGVVETNRAAFFLVGSFMAAWVIFYGAVQAASPAILRAKGKETTAIAGLARAWAGRLALIPAALALLALLLPQGPLALLLVAGLLAFGLVFALNSALHSYLILAFAGAGRVTMDVGFYYMANAAGRLAGTLLSGLSYTLGGLPACLGTAAAMAGLGWLATRRLAPS